MTLWKPYRVLFRQGYHYFETLTKAREFIKNFEKQRVYALTIEKLNKTKLKNVNYRYDQIYDDYEHWTVSSSQGKWSVTKI